MRPTLSQLRAWDPQSIAAAGSAASTLAERIDTGIGRAVRAFDDASGWSGGTHDAAHQAIWAEHDHAGDVRGCGMGRGDRNGGRDEHRGGDRGPNTQADGKAHVRHGSPAAVRLGSPQLPDR